MGESLEVLEDKRPAMPEGLAQARINPETGMLARAGDPDSVMEVFQAGRLPPMPADVEGEDQDAPLEEDPYEIY
jgi:penicillin-binding protein 1A